MGLKVGVKVGAERCPGTGCGWAELLPINGVTIKNSDTRKVQTLLVSVKLTNKLIDWFSKQVLWVIAAQRAPLTITHE
ncbi:hypothetical protein DFR27_0593 [Umboniibacter marinipuniceus]|uniref:Uncharacterized protein n=1 Tax=Umboniibacter marinipuniceus TaxID=569599 RepID=A0A3M0ABV5_9GAMM|nr:hypothetical protein DFR27_0593 [Umboniibacter marinipuniceus]